jgi:MoxR-like ATPase
MADIDPEAIRGKISNFMSYIEKSGLYTNSIKDVSLTLSDNGRVAEEHKYNSTILFSLSNGCISNSGMILRGGKGGGKTSFLRVLGYFLTGEDYEKVPLVRGHPEQTEEKMIARYSIPDLMQGKEKVEWHDFVTSKVKILDEHNRLPPSKQDILFSMLNGEPITYGDSINYNRDFRLFATENPDDEGTFPMSGPYLDRFSVSVPTLLPRTRDMLTIMNRADPRMGRRDEFDELVKGIEPMTEQEFKCVPGEVDKVGIQKSAMLSILGLYADLNLCERTIGHDKSQGSKRPGTGLCKSCHYETAQNLCNHTEDGISPRAILDLQRHSKFVAWLHGSEGDPGTVTSEVVQAVAPYVILGRVKPVQRWFNKSPFHGADSLAYVSDIVSKSIERTLGERMEPFDVYCEAEKSGDRKKVEDAIVSFKDQDDMWLKFDLVGNLEDLLLVLNGNMRSS